MPFNDTSITFGVAGLQGELSSNPTAIDASKTGSPYIFVAQQDAKIYRYEIVRQADSFSVANAVLIDSIKLETQNYNDDGTLNSTTNRQVTGMVTTVDALGRDVLYVSSSDWRIAVGEDTGLDTNSGQIHRITLDAAGNPVEVVAVVRGLPRSEENHSTNGLDLSVDPVTGDVILWIAQGGNTNKGAPGNNFAGTVDYAYSGAVLKLNLTQLDAYDIRTDGSGDQFILDLSTLDDPTRPNVDLAALGIQNLNLDPNFTLDSNGSGANGQLNPDWAGGNNGLNMAKISNYVLVSEAGELKLVDNPLNIHSPGLRNNYDVLVTDAGEVFTWDNGPNGGWGGLPIAFVDNTPGTDNNWLEDWETELATNQFNENGSVGWGDQLHYLGGIADTYGPYAGSANPIRAAKEVLEAAFNSDGTYKGATSDDPITVNNTQIFSDESQARAFLASLLIIYEEDGDGNWVDVTGSLPVDLFDFVSGYDWVHPGSSLSDVTAYYDGTSIMEGTAFSPEAQTLPNTADGSLKTVNASTNGLAEYTATFFGNALDGAIIAASFDGNLYFEMPIDTDGDGRTDSVNSLGTIGNFGSNPLSVAALGDHGFSSDILIDNNGDGVDDFAGLIFAATHGSDDITVFIPGGTPLDASTDLDLDGVDNVEDTHVGDPLDGLGVPVGGNATALWHFELNNPDSTPPGAIPPGDSIAGDIGINAVWRDGVTPQVNNQGGTVPGLYDLGVWNLGGASSFVTIDRAHDGTAIGRVNSQQDVLGIGFGTEPFTGSVAITTQMINIFTYSLNKDAAKTWDGGEKAGLMVGPGDQTTFAEATIAVIDDNGTIRYGVQLVVEENEVPQTVFVEIPGIENPVISGLGDPDFELAIDVDLTPGAETASARARYVDDGVFTSWVETPELALPADVVAAITGTYLNQNQTTGAVVGLVSSAATGDDSFGAGWDFVEITGTPSNLPREVIERWNAGSSTVSATDAGLDWVNDPSVVVSGDSKVSKPISITNLDSSVPLGTPTEIFSQEQWDPATDGEMGLAFDVPVNGDYEVRLYLANGYDGTSEPGQRQFDVLIENELFLNDIDLSAVFGHQVGGMLAWEGTVVDGTINIDFKHVIENPLINAVEILMPDTSGASDSVAGAAILAINETANNVQVSNFGSGSFNLTNFGDKIISEILIDVTGALYPDTVFDPFELAGDITGTPKPITIDNAGGTGVVAPNNSADDPDNQTYIGAGGIDGYEGIRLLFDQAVNGGFEPGETLSFSVDMDPNSIAGAEKSTLDGGSVPSWDVGGVSGAELIGSSFTVTFADGTTATGDLIGTKTQGGSRGLADQASQNSSVTLTVNGLGAGGVGTYDANTPTVAISGPQGLTARVVLTKGFIQPVNNNFEEPYASQLDAQLAELAAQNFPANNAVEFQTVDVTLTGSTQDISHLFDYSGVPIYDFAGEDQLPIGFTSSIIDPAQGDLPLGPVTDPIYLTFNAAAPPPATGVVHRWNAGSVVVAANDGGIDWSNGTSVLVGGETKISKSIEITTLDSSVPSTAPAELFWQERWDPATGEEMQFEFAVDSGDYMVRLFFANGWDGTDEPGERQFDVFLEDTLVFDNFDPTATFGDQVGGMVERNVSVTDGILDIDFAHVVENPLINAIEIIGLTEPISISVADATATEAEGTVNVAISADRTVPTDETVTVSYEVRPIDGGATPGVDYSVPNATFSDGVYSASGTIAGGSADLTFAVSLEADGIAEPDEAFEVVITGVSGAGATIGDGSATIVIVDSDSSSTGVVHRWNAGSSTVAANDGGIDWSNGTSVLVGGKTSISDPIEITTLDSSVPATAPAELFWQERWDPATGEEMQFEFAVDSGDYMVRLFFANGWDGTNEPGERQFDVFLEDTLVFDDFDPTATFGHQVGGMVERNVSVTDGILDIDFAHVVENPLINAIEILALDTLI